MALNGTTTVKTSDKSNLEFKWVRESYSIVNNTSVISWQFTFNNTGMFLNLSSNNPYYIEINGNTYEGNVDSLYIGSDGGTVIIATGTTVIPHNADGTRNFGYSFSQSLQTQGVKTGTGIGTLDAIPRPAVVTLAPDFNDEENPTVNYATYVNGAAQYEVMACISFTGALDDISYREISNTDGSYTFNLTDAERQTLRKYLTTSTSGQVKFFVRTIIDGTTYLNAKNATFYLINYEPTLNPRVVATDARTKELTGNNDGGVIIKYASDVSFNTRAVANKEASLVYHTITCGSTTLDDYVSTTGTIADVDSNTFYFSVTDSRGITVRKAVVFSKDSGQFIPYVKLTNNIKTTALTANGALTFTIAGKYYSGSFGAKSNSLEVEYTVIDESGNPVFNTSGSGWVQLGTVTPTVDSEGNYTYSYTINGLNYQKEYTLTVNAIDELTPVQSATKVISSIPIFDWSKTDFNFNIPVYLNNTTIPLESLADYVIEQGTSGIWTYRKWYSGRLYLSGQQAISARACTTAFGSMFRTGVVTGAAYPFKVYDATISATYDSAGYGALVWPTLQGNTEKPFSFYLIRPTSSDSIEGQVHFNITGRWK